MRHKMARTPQGEDGLLSLRGFFLSKGCKRKAMLLKLHHDESSVQKTRVITML